MKPLEGYQNGSWDVTPPTTVSGTKDDVYTYTFEKIAVPIIPEIENPQTGDEIQNSLTLMLISLIGLVSVSVYYKKSYIK